MKQQRLEQLADGIFSIVMTLLVLEIKVPGVPFSSEMVIIESLRESLPLYLSYLLSFIMLFTYWRSHHFVTSVFAQNIDQKLVNINAVFFFLIAFVPFSSHLLGSYSGSIVAIDIFAIHTIVIGALLFWMRYYAERSVSIASTEMSPVENRHAYARIMFPVVSAMLAMIISPFSTQIALVIFTLGLVLNYAKRSTKLFFLVASIFYPKWKE